MCKEMSVNEPSVILENSIFIIGNGCEKKRAVTFFLCHHQYRPLVAGESYDTVVRSCAILARIFWVLSWDCKISGYLGIVLRLSLNFIILGNGIEIEIEFWILQYWFWYWYLVLMFLISILRLRLKFLSPVSIIRIVSFHKLIKLCYQAVNS